MSAAARTAVGKRRHHIGWTSAENADVHMQCCFTESLRTLALSASCYCLFPWLSDDAKIMILRYLGAQKFKKMLRGAAITPPSPTKTTGLILGRECVVFWGGGL